MLIREFYFKCLTDYGDNAYLNDVVLRSLIIAYENIADMSSFYVHLDDKIANLIKLQDAIEQVGKGEPYQYVLKCASFLGHEYFVDERVLIPRLETEELVSYVISCLKDKKNLTVADIGTGSGCIAIEIKKACPSFKVFATDISSSALEVSVLNIERFDVVISLMQGDMLMPFLENNIKLDVIVSNPPYINNEKEVDQNVLEYEPHLALFARSGIDYYEEILKNAPSILNKEGMIFFEFNYDQKESLIALINEHLPHSSYVFFQDVFLKWRYVKIMYIA